MRNTLRGSIDRLMALEQNILNYEPCLYIVTDN